MVKKYIEGRYAPFMDIKTKDETRDSFLNLKVFRKQKLTAPPLFLFEKKLKFKLD